MTRRAARDDGWGRTGSREPLQAELHGDLAAMCTQPGVQDAPTVSEMIARSGIPREYWYPPVIAPKPVVPKVDVDEASAIARRCTELRETRRYSRPVLAGMLCVAPGALWRIEQGRIKHDELVGVRSALDKIESGELAPAPAE